MVPTSDKVPHKGIVNFAVMTDPRKISVLDYTYELPADRIAEYPLPQRDASRLLIYDNGKIIEDIYRNLASYLPADSFLIFNDSKVVEARLLFHKSSGGVIEIFCLEPGPGYKDITTAMATKEKVNWLCLIGGASKWKAGQVLKKKITIGNNEIILNAQYKEKNAENFLIELSWSPSSLSFAEILHYTGSIPLPPYIKRVAEESDLERYQTIYANEEGSVAAPTAGLHFTNEMMEDLKSKGIVTQQLTLHVGAGTFKPVKSSTMEDHLMHAEWIDVKQSTIVSLLQNLDKNIVAVGTTSLRTLESLYWMGVQLAIGSGQLPVLQWEAYVSRENNISVEQSLMSIIKWMDEKEVDRLVTKTQLLIVPGYEFRIADALITNFHQPGSTLLLLVAAFIGEDWRNVYQYALDNDFRFLSYGDGNLYFRPINRKDAKAQ